MEECVETNTQLAEDIEAARLLIHLSTVVSDSAATITLRDDDRYNHSSSSNNSYSVESMAKGGGGADVSLSSFSEEKEKKEEEIIEDVLADIEDDERFRRKNKRWRYLDDLYRVTLPLLRLEHGHGHHVSSAAVTTVGNKISNKFICRDSRHINILCFKLNNSHG